MIPVMASLNTDSAYLWRKQSETTMGSDSRSSVLSGKSDV